MGSDWNASHTAGGGEGARKPVFPLWKTSLAASYEIKQTSLLGPKQSPPGDLPQRNKHMCTKRCVHECPQ